MRKRKIKQISLGILISLIVSIPIFISSNTYATGPLQDGTDPRVIFAAACATCHGDKGTGGVTWIKMSPADRRIAPPLVNLSASSIYHRVRQGAPSAGMPAFGKEIITSTELMALANFIANSPQSGVEPPPAPAGTAIRLDILDADPWFTDRGADNVLDPGGPTTGPTDGDIKRVALGPIDYLKIYNTGRTWHTFTHPGPIGPATSKDSGFIGYAGNYDTTPGDLGDMGYYYADQTTGLLTGCNRYLCRMHPYMQVEVCTNGTLPAQSNDANVAAVVAGTGSIGLTRAHKHPLAVPPVPGIGEVWVSVQSQEELGEDTYTQGNNSVSGFDGTYQVIDAATWTVPGANLIHNVGNNPHNSWPGRDSGMDVVLTSSWHDNYVTLMNASTKAIISSGRTGADDAHIMTAPDNNLLNKDRFFVTHMGGIFLQEFDVDSMSNSGLKISGNTGPHGLWMCDDGQHVLTADTFGGSATLYNVSGLYGGGTSTTASSGGAAPLAPSIMSGFQGGCSRGFTNNALTADVSIYDITLGSPYVDPPTQDAIAHNDGWAAIGTGTKNAANNIALRDTINDQVAGGPFQARWANLPIQTPVSPGDATTHNQFIVTANKASFNVSITGLRASDGLPWGLFTIPAGLGAHGVTYGRKASCDVNDDGVINAEEINNNNGTTIQCYYAYVSNTFEDYVSVYDLDKIDINDDYIDNNLTTASTDTNAGDVLGQTPGILCFDAPGDIDLNGDLLCNGAGMQGPGSAILAETVYVEGGAVAAVIALDPTVAELCDAAGAGDPLGDLDLNGIDSGAGPLGDILDCGVGAMGGGALFVSNLPIGVLCPDCRSGVHAGDVPLRIGAANLVGGAPLAYDVTAVLASDGDLGYVGGQSGATANYTYVKDDVYVDTETVTCTLAALYPAAFTGLPGGGYGGLNDCDGDTLLRDTDVPIVFPEADAGDTAGTLNQAVPMDLELGINTGGQGITGVPAAFPWP